MRRGTQTFDGKGKQSCLRGEKGCALESAGRVGKSLPRRCCALKSAHRVGVAIQLCRSPRTSTDKTRRAPAHKMVEAKA